MHRGPGRALGAGVAIALILGALAATPVAAAAPVTFQLDLGDDCVRVNGASGTNATVRELSPTNDVMGAVDITLNGSGTGSACFLASFQPGLKVQATASGTTRTLTIPALSARIDRAADVVKGVAPKSSTLVLTVYHWTSFSALTQHDLVVHATSTGRYSRDTTSTIAITGGDKVWVAWQSASGDRVRAVEQAPQLAVWIGRPRMAALLLSGTGGSVALKTPGGVTRAKALVAWDGSSGNLFDGATFRSSAGGLVSPRIGDKVVSALQPDMHFTIPTLTASASAASDVVHGSCPAHRPLRLTLANGGSTVFVGSAICSAAGTYSFDFAPNADVLVGQRVDVAAKLATGDLVVRRTVAGS